MPDLPTLLDALETQMRTPRSDMDTMHDAEHQRFPKAGDSQHLLAVLLRPSTQKIVVSQSIVLYRCQTPHQSAHAELEEFALFEEHKEKARDNHNKMTACLQDCARVLRNSTGFAALDTPLLLRLSVSLDHASADLCATEKRGTQYTKTAFTQLAFNSLLPLRRQCLFLETYTSTGKKEKWITKWRHGVNRKNTFVYEQEVFAANRKDARMLASILHSQRMLKSTATVKKVKTT